MGGIGLSTQAARRSLIATAAAVLGAALLATAQVPAAAVASGPAAARSPARPAAAKPSPKPTKSTPAKPAKPPTPSVPRPVATEPTPNSNCSAQNPVSRVTTVPWAQKVLDFASAWPLSEGQGVTVAVVDSGVDFNRQLSGKVTAINLVTTDNTGFGDCEGHGTLVAGIIAARDLQAQGYAFEGVAPEAKILSVKVQSGEQGDATVLAQGIRDAATLGAQVINVSITGPNTSALRSAVDFALSKNAVVVAAGGNDTQETGIGPFYPASYPGVLSVGAVNQDGSLAPFSDLRSHVAVTAPGTNIVSTAPGGYGTDNGTSFATAFVSGVAALVRSRYPGLSQSEVVARIKATANGGSGPGTGDGLVDALQAVSAIPAPSATPSPSAAAAPQAVRVLRAPPRDQAAIEISMILTVGAVGLAVVVAIGAIVVRNGRRRRWRAGTLTLPPPGAAADDPSS